MASTAKMTSLSSTLKPLTAARMGLPMRVAPSQRRVVCNAQMDTLKKAAVVATPALLATSPACARIVETMNSEGTGLALGVTDGILGWAMLITFGAVWAVYAISAKQLGGGETDDSGLSL